MLLTEIENNTGMDFAHPIAILFIQVVIAA